MRVYCTDLDLFKIILGCDGVDKVDWRISASGRGMHIVWTCNKSRCSWCSKIEKQFDDPKRYRRDQKRPSHWRRVLWDIKGGKKAGLWKTIIKENTNG